MLRKVIKPVKNDQEIRVPLGEKYFFILLTKNINAENVKKLEKLCNQIDWDNSKFVFLPSEYVHSITFYKKRWLSSKNTKKKSPVQTPNATTH